MTWERTLHLCISLESVNENYVEKHRGGSVRVLQLRSAVNYNQIPRPLRQTLIVGKDRIGWKAHMLKPHTGLLDHFARAADQSDGRFQIRQHVIQQ